MNRAFEITSEADMTRFASAFAIACRGGLVVGLSGTLGAGKTFFVRAVAESLGIAKEIVLSPTFTLCNEYPSTPKIYHLDLYRVRDADEYYELGVEEMCNHDSLVFIEWADRFAHELPRDRLNVHIELTGENGRQIELAAAGNLPVETAASIRFP